MALVGGGRDEGAIHRRSSFHRQVDSEGHGLAEEGAAPSRAVATRFEKRLSADADSNPPQSRVLWTNRQTGDAPIQVPCGRVLPDQTWAEFCHPIAQNLSLGK